LVLALLMLAPLSACKSYEEAAVQKLENDAAVQKFESEYFQNGAFEIPEISIAQNPEICDEFIDLEWGESYDRLFEEDRANYVVQYGVTYAGFMGSAYYFFRDEALWQGEIVFYELDDKSDLDIYLELYNYLLEIYGEALDPGAASSFVLIEEAMLTGEGYCGASWHVETSQGDKVQISILFDAAKRQTIGGGKTSVIITAAH